MFHELNTLQQNSCVEHYIKEFEWLSLACDCEDEEHKVCEILIGLNVDIAHKVKLQSFLTFDEVCELVVEVEGPNKNLKNRSFKTNFNNKSDSSKNVEKFES